MKTRHWAGAVFVLLAVAGCGGKHAAAGGDAVASQDDTFLLDNDAWRAQRREELLEPDGWTALVGLYWLELKASYIGSDADNGIRLAYGPPKLGMVERSKDGRVHFVPQPGAAVTVDGAPAQGRVELKNDHEGTPTAIGFDDGKGVLTLIRRGDRLALRAKHADAPGRTHFKGLDYWPASRDWRIVGRFVPNPPGTTLPVLDIVGITTDTPNPGAVEFAHGGKTYRLQALDDGDGLFFVFVDRTSGHGSYPAGRFLDADRPDAAGNVTLDFNRAYNPPCAFTPYATCPLPPNGNRLEDLAIEAGEKVYVPPAEARPAE